MNQDTKKVLVVEDDVDLLNVLTDRLGVSNYEVMTAKDGEQAVSLILDKKPDLILLDLLLPKLDGFQVLERIRRYPDNKISDIKVIVLSNLWSDKDILRAQALKIDEYYVKANTNLDEVFSKIAKII